MAKKKNVEKPQRHMTKRALSSIKRQQRRQRFIFWGGILVVVAVIAVVITGVMGEEVMPYRQTVLEVYDREFNARYVMDGVNYLGRYYPDEMYQYYLSDLVNSSYNAVIDSELVRRGAEGLGITVDDEEVIAFLEESGLEINDASIDIARTSLLGEKLLEEHFNPQVPATADQVNVMAMLLESENEALTITGELAADGDFAELAEEYSLDSYTQGEWHTREYLENELGTAVPVDSAFDAEPGTLSQPLYDEKTKPVGYWLVNVLELQEDYSQAYVQVILLGSREEADMALQRLVLNGEDFEELAQELSRDEASREDGGDLGVVTQDSLADTSAVLAAYIFDPEVVGDVGIVGPLRDDGVSTTGGYWLVEVVDREEGRALEEADKEYFAGQYYEDWKSQLWEDATDAIDQEGLTGEIWQWMVEKLAKENQ